MADLNSLSAAVHVTSGLDGGDVEYEYIFIFIFHKLHITGDIHNIHHAYIIGVHCKVTTIFINIGDIKVLNIKETPSFVFNLVEDYT